MIDSRSRTVKVLAGLAIIMLVAMQMVNQESNMPWYRFLTWTTWPMIFFLVGYMIKPNQKLLATFKQGIVKDLIPYFVIGFMLIITSKIVQMFGLAPALNQPFLAIRVGVKAVLYGNGWPGATMIWPFQTGIGLIWVFLALFWATLLTTLIIKIKPIFVQILLVALLTYVGFYISRIVQLPWSVLSGVVVQPLMLLGHHFNDSKKAWQPALATVVAGGIISWIMARVGAYEMTVAQTNHWIIGTGAAIIILEAMLIIAWYISEKFAKLSMVLTNIGTHLNISIAILSFIVMIIPVKYYLNSLLPFEWLSFLLAWILVGAVVYGVKLIIVKGLHHQFKREG